jgi:hypothetical protein
MNYEDLGSPPTLVLPLVNPNLRVSKGKNRPQKPLRQPPFPEIDLNWDGFAITHLHLGGFNNSAPRERWRIELAMRHEFLGHCFLALSPYLRFIKYEMIELYGLMWEIFKEREERIEVPLSTSNSKNVLIEKLMRLVSLKKRSSLVEEVYAIRSSLFSVQHDTPIVSGRENEIITEEDLKELTEQYKNAYEKYFPHFSKIYEKYDQLCGKIGEEAATAMVEVVFKTSNPLKTFLDLLWGIEIRTEGDFTDLPRQIAYPLWHEIISRMDPDDSCYERKFIKDAVAKAETIFGIGNKDREDDFQKFWLSIPDTFMITPYTNHIYPPVEVEDISKRVVFTSYGRFIIALEAILQQLTRGLGLLCPSWSWASGTCCGGHIKELFEKVWECTSNSACDRWQRMGCLVKGACKGQRKRIKVS